jgi:hypothetical protein
MFSIRQSVTALALLTSVIPAAAEPNCARPASFASFAGLQENLSGGPDISNLKVSAISARFLRRPICMAGMPLSLRSSDCATRFMTANLD